MKDPSTQTWSPWPHRAACLLVCATFPLIWIGGLVTTYDAGMAVPDWPSTYGHNLFLYPWKTWFAGPWDLFIEHGHRLFASAVGLLCMVMVAVTWRYESRTWVKWAALGALCLVIAQGVLGGVRVLWDDRNIARIHGITAPMFFTYTAILAAVTSRAWWRVEQSPPPASACPFGTTAWFLALTALLQLVFGSQLRHVTGLSSGDLFGLALSMHLVGAVCTGGLGIILAITAVRACREFPRMSSVAGLLAGCVMLQLLLGIGTWISKYGGPAWLRAWFSLEGYTVQANGMAGATITTAHVAIGSLILALSVFLAVWDWRLAKSGHPRRNTVVRMVSIGTVA